MTTPDVSVIISVYNAMPYLTQCLTSVAEQTLGSERIEVIAVDDGSTDGSCDELERMADKHANIRVVRLPHSGSPSAPRNTGVQRASGRFVFFLDADDYLGGECLERMVRVADRFGSDIVLGRIRGVGGRSVPKSMYRATVRETDIFSSRAYWTLNSFKLFRRDLIQQNGIRFPDDIRLGEDQLFTAEAYLHAGRISILADYDYYYWRHRADGGNVTKTVTGKTDIWMRQCEAVVALVARHVPPGTHRDGLLRRHFYTELLYCFRQDFLWLTPGAQRGILERAGKLIDEHYTAGIAESLPVHHRVVYHCVRQRHLDLLVDTIRSCNEPLLPTDAVLVGPPYKHHRCVRHDSRKFPAHLLQTGDRVPFVCQLNEYECSDQTLRVGGYAYFEDSPDLETDLHLVLLESRTGRSVRIEVGSESRGRAAATTAVHPPPNSTFSRPIDLRSIYHGQTLPAGQWELLVSASVATTDRRQRVARLVRSPDTASLQPVVDWRQPTTPAVLTTARRVGR